MDGFLVKPISLEALDEAVRAATVGQFNSGAAFSSNANANLLPDAVQSTEENNQLSGGREDRHMLKLEQAFAAAPSWQELIQLMQGNEKLLRDVLALLAREAPRLGRDFQSALEQAKLTDARRAVHTLKSNVRHVGLKRIGEYAERLERLARDQQTGELQLHSENLAMLANKTADWAEQQLKLNPS